ncbi:MAG: UPF0280 family protein [Candidatus Lokiarchaeota archaeon]|nr:UPF0280 family protein [Candidatus Lokiarchaeota archaeon]
MIKYHFSEKESDITLISDSETAIIEAKKSFYRHRVALEKYVQIDDKFLKSFSPVPVKSKERVVILMSEVAYACDVGPMAAVAGAIADLMLEAMKTKEESAKLLARDALVENGGEIAIDSDSPMKIALYAGENDLNLNLGFLIEKKDCPIGIGTSSATIGHAISLGQADAVTIFAKNAALADAAATRIANLVKGTDVEKSIKKALDAVDDIEGLRGAFISRENKVGQVGKLPQMIRIEGNKQDILKEKALNMFPGDFEVFK